MSDLILRGTVIAGGRRIDDGIVAVTGDRIGWVGPTADWTEARTRRLRPTGCCFPGSSTSTATAGPATVSRRRTRPVRGTRWPTTAPTARRRCSPAWSPRRRRARRGGSPRWPRSSPTACWPASTWRARSSPPRGAVRRTPPPIRPGDPAVLREVLDAAPGAVATMTLAPETARFDDLLAVLAEHGVVPSLGHTDATAAATTAAVRAARAVAGERLSATHLFNAMPPLHHRAPGPVAACLAAAARGEMVVELVADGVHLADDTVATVFDLVGPGQIALVTDAMAAAGMPDGDYPLGSMPVAVRAGVARLRTPDGPGAIAGGTAHMVDLVRRAVHHAGVDLRAAVTAASATPATLLGLAHEVGDLRPGLRADVLVTDPDLDPVAVLAAGAWVPRPTLVHA